MGNSNRVLLFVLHKTTESPPRHDDGVRVLTRAVDDPQDTWGWVNADIVRELPLSFPEWARYPTKDQGLTVGDVQAILRRLDSSDVGRELADKLRAAVGDA